MPLFNSRVLAACPAHRSTSQTTPIQQAASEIKVQMVNGQPSYTSRLQQIRALLTQENVPSADEVQALLGHGVLAGLAVRLNLMRSLMKKCISYKEMEQYRPVIALRQLSLLFRNQ